MIGRRSLGRLGGALCFAAALLLGAPALAADAQIATHSESDEYEIALPAKIAYVRLVERDLDKAVEFWTKGVGMKRTTRPNGEPGEVVLQFDQDLTQKSPAIGLILVGGGGNITRFGKTSPDYQYRDGKKFPRLVFAVASIPKVVARARFRGLKVEDVTDKHAYITEPNGGNMIELIPLSDLPDRPSKYSLQRITYVKLITTDFFQIGDFLGNVLGMQETGSAQHPQRNREMIFSYRLGGPERPWKHGVIATVYMWDYAETMEPSIRDIASRFCIEIAGDWKVVTKKLTDMGYPQPAWTVRPQFLDPGGNLVEVSKENMKDP